MAFLNVDKVKRMAQAASTAEHPLLSMIALDAAVRTAYVQGCVLAALIDDAKISEQERERVRRVGLSLRMPDDEIEECFGIVSSLSSDDEKERFLTEILGLLKPDLVGRYFMADFESILQLKGKVEGEVLELLNNIGTALFKDADWRQKRVVAEKDAAEATNERKEEVARKEHAKQEHVASKTHEAASKGLVDVVLVAKRAVKFVDFLDYVVGFFDCDLEKARESWSNGSGVLFEKTEYKKAEAIVEKLQKIGCKAKIQMSGLDRKKRERCADDSCKKDESTGPVRRNWATLLPLLQGHGQSWSVWMTAAPNIVELPADILYACGGPKRFRGRGPFGCFVSSREEVEKIGVLRSNISREEAERIKVAFEKAGGSVDIRPS